MIYTIDTSDAYKCLIFAECKLRLHPSTTLTVTRAKRERRLRATCCAQVHAFRYAMRGERTRRIYSSGSAYSRATLPPSPGQIWSRVVSRPFCIPFFPLHLTANFLLFSTRRERTGWK